MCSSTGESVISPRSKVVLTFATDPYAFAAVDHAKSLAAPGTSIKIFGRDIHHILVESDNLNADQVEPRVTVVGSEFYI